MSWSQSTCMLYWSLVLAVSGFTAVLQGGWMGNLSPHTFLFLYQFHMQRHFTGWMQMGRNSANNVVDIWMDKQQDTAEEATDWWRAGHWSTVHWRGEQSYRYSAWLLDESVAAWNRYCGHGLDHTSPQMNHLSNTNTAATKVMLIFHLLVELIRQPMEKCAMCV